MEKGSPEPPVHRPSRQPEAWILNEGELTPELLQGVGRLMYIALFAHINHEVLGMLQPDGLGKTTQDPWRMPASQYLETVAPRLGLELELARRWMDAAAREMAQTHLDEHLRPFLKAQEKWHSKNPILQQCIADVQLLARDGIAAPLTHHRYLAFEVFQERLSNPDYPGVYGLARTAQSRRGIRHRIAFTTPLTGSSHPDPIGELERRRQEESRRLKTRLGEDEYRRRERHGELLLLGHDDHYPYPD